MKSTIEQIIESYNPKSKDETKMALREVIQLIVLIGLSRAGFFNKASFYGGTALRVFYGLNRYSEDLDFTLNEKNLAFSIEPYIESIKNTAQSYGVDLDIQIKNKKINTPIESAFAKINTYQTFISLKLDEKSSYTLHKDEVLKVKFEVDCNPPLGFFVESKWTTTPEFAVVNVLDEPSLFAGKLHAILCRNYRNHIKGRDYYDFLFYIKKGVKPNLEYLKNKLVETGKIKKEQEFTLDILKQMLLDRFNNIDFNQVKEDVKRYVLKNQDLSYICKDLFMDCLNKL